MVIHRDYRASSDSIVKIYDKSIEFFNPGKLPDDISIDDLLKNNYKSTPRNKLIADFCRSIGLIEKYGSGIQRVIEHFKKAGLPQPEFKNISGGFMVTVFAAEPENVGENVGENRLDRIIAEIKRNNTISAKELAKLFSVNNRTIERDMEKLKQMNRLKRFGSDKSGHWEVLEKD